MPPKKGLKRKRLAKATTVEPGLTEEPSPTVEPSTTTTVEPSTTTTVEPGSTEEPSPTVEPSNTTTVEQGSTEEPSPTAIEGEGVEEQQVPGTLSPVLEESYKNEEENSEKNEEEESGEEESEEEDKEEEKEEGNEEGNEEGEESSDDDGSRSLGGESSSDESKEDEIAPENQPENAMEIDEETEAIPPLSMYFPPSEYVKKIRTVKMATFVGSDSETTSSTSRVIDSHLHIWASPQEAATYPYFPGQEPTLIGDVDFLLKNMEEARVDGALIVQPINHKFDHSLVTSVLKKYPSKFVGCCLANPAEDGSGITHLENLVLESNYRTVRFNPYLWPLGQKMTNPVGKALFSKAGELGVPVGFMCMKNSGGSMMSFILIDDIAPSVLRKRELCGTQTIVAHLLKHSHSDTAKGQDERMALEIAPGRHQIISRTEGCFTTIHCFNQNHRNVILSKETVPHCDHEANVGCLI